MDINIIIKCPDLPLAAAAVQGLEHQGIVRCLRLPAIGGTGGNDPARTLAGQQRSHGLLVPAQAGAGLVGHAKHASQSRKASLVGT